MLINFINYNISEHQNLWFCNVNLPSAVGQVRIKIYDFGLRTYSANACESSFLKKRTQILYSNIFQAFNFIFDLWFCPSNLLSELMWVEFPLNLNLWFYWLNLLNTYHMIVISPICILKFSIIICYPISNDNILELLTLLSSVHSLVLLIHIIC